MTTDSASKISPNFLISGADYLNDHPNFRDEEGKPGFKLIGRKDELGAMMDVLLKKSAGSSNNLIVTGQRGAGLSSLVMGLQASKKDPATPVDIVEKNFFYLDVDALFSSSDTKDINAGFQKAMSAAQTSQGNDTVLVIEDTKGFLNGIIDNRVTNMINILMRAARTNPHFQVIFVAADEDLPTLYKSHADIERIFTRKFAGEPSKDDLRGIVEVAAKEMGEQYGVDISQKAIDSVLELVEKYPGITARVGFAQPRCSIELLEGAMTAFLRTAQAKPPGLAGLEETLAIVTTALQSGQPAEGDLADRSQEELKAIRLATEDSIRQVTQEWEGRQQRIAKLYDSIAKGQKQIQQIIDGISALQEKSKAKSDAMDQLKDADAEMKAAKDEKPINQETIDGLQQTIDRVIEDFKGNYGETLFIPAEESPNKRAFNGLRKPSGQQKAQFYVTEIREAQEEREKFEAALANTKESYKELTQNDDDKRQKMTDDDVMAEFSRVSGVDVSKLNQDDRKRLLGMEGELESRIFGQSQAVKAVVKAVQRGTVFRQKKDKPKGSFFFVGPSGVGKTELAKVLADFLYRNEDALNTYTMPEYSSQSDASKLLGPSPGLVGYDAGGTLTNNLFRNPSCVNLFDEIEKAHPDIFDPLMRFIDEGRIQDNHGRTATGGETINIFTSNIGSKYFLDAPDTKEGFEEACRKAKQDLYRHTDPETGKEVGLRPEFLNRFGEDDIIFFNRLDNGKVVLVASKYLKACNEQSAAQGITIEMSQEDKEAMVAEKYKPALGARVIEKYIDNAIASDVAETLLREPDKKGVVKVTYTPTEQLPAKDREAENPKNISTEFVSDEAPAQAATNAAQVPANSNTLPAARPAVG